MEPKAMIQNPLPVNPAISSNNVEPRALAKEWAFCEY